MNVNIRNYEEVKDYLLEERLKWMESFDLLEELVDTSKIIMCYPKGLFREGYQSVELIMFFEDRIVSAITGAEIEIKVYNMDVSKLGLYRKKSGDIELRIFLKKSDIIVMSSGDDTNESNREAFAEILLDIFRLLNK